MKLTIEEVQTRTPWIHYVNVPASTKRRIASENPIDGSLWQGQKNSEITMKGMTHTQAFIDYEKQ